MPDRLTLWDKSSHVERDIALLDNGNNTYSIATYLHGSDIIRDGGGRLRVAQYTTLGDYKILNADRPILWEVAGTGTGAYLNNKYTMTVGAGQWLVRSTRRPHPYFSGKSQAVECTFDGFGPESGVVKRVGYFSSSSSSPYSSTLDGFYLENDGTTIKLISSRAGTETLNIDITEWDNYNGLGEYKEVSNWANFTVILFDFLWLGGAILRLWLKTSEGFILAHTFNYSGRVTDVFILSPNQPIRYSIRSSTGTGSFRYICSHVATEGSIDEDGLSIGVITGATAITLATIGTSYPLIGVRKKTTHRDIAIRISEISIDVASNDRALWTLQVNPTLSAPLTYSDVANSAIQWGPGNGTITVATPGRIIANGFVKQSTPIEAQALLDNYLSYLGGALDNTMDRYILCVTPITSNVAIHGGFVLKEY